METAWAQASEIAAAIREGRAKASDVVTAALARIGQSNPALNAFTAVLGERAVAKAAAIDKAPVNARAALPLAGVPFVALTILCSWLWYLALTVVPALVAATRSPEQAPT